MINLPLEFLSDVLGTPAEQIAAAIKDGENFRPDGEVQDWLKQALAEKIYQAKRETKEQQYSRGRKEALTVKERELRDKYGLEGDTIDAMIEALQEATKNKPDLTPADVRNTEIYKIDVKQIKDQLAEAERKAKEAQDHYQKEMVKFKARQIGAQLLKKHNFVLPDGIEDAAAWEDLLYSRLNEGDYRLALQDGKIQVLDENGSPAQDERLNPIDFEAHFTRTAKRLFKVAASDDRDSPGNTTKPGQQGAAAGSGTKPADQAAFLQGVANAKTPEAKRAYIKQYGAEFGVSG